MKEIYTKRITALSDKLPVRTEKGIEVEYTEEGKVTDIYVVDSYGRKRIDLDGNVEPEKTLSHNATGTTVVSVPVSEGYTSQGDVTVNVTVTPVELTQAEYDALTVKDPNTIYLISD